MILIWPVSDQLGECIGIKSQRWWEVHWVMRCHCHCMTFVRRQKLFLGEKMGFQKSLNAFNLMWAEKGLTFCQVVIDCLLLTKPLTMEGWNFNAKEITLSKPWVSDTNNAIFTSRVSGRGNRTGPAFPSVCQFVSTLRAEPCYVHMSTISHDEKSLIATCERCINTQAFSLQPEWYFAKFYRTNNMCLMDHCGYRNADGEIQKWGRADKMSYHHLLRKVHEIYVE